jgi:hypothetical protein
MTGGIKSRLGTVGPVVERPTEAYDPEAAELRRQAASKLDLRDRLDSSPRRRVVEEDGDSEGEEMMLRRQRKLVKKEKKLREESKLERILKKEDKVRRKLERREHQLQREREAARSAVLPPGPRVTRTILVEGGPGDQRHLPSASDYSDLESPEREAAPAIVSVASRAVRVDRSGVVREERRLRMLQRELEREDDRSKQKRKEAKQTYAGKVS